MKLRHFFCFGLLLLHAPLANAQTDTVKYRLLTSFLNDSTLIKYELGSLGLQKGASLKYLSFSDATPSNIGEYFRTEYFRIDSLVDSLSFRRFSSFDSNIYHVLYHNIDSSHTSSSWIAFNNALRSRTSTSYNIVPDVGIFDSASRIRYIVEVHDSTTGIVVARIDTLKCFLKSGHLVYATFPSNGSIRHRSLVDLPHNAALYITVSRTAALKGTGSIIGDQFTMESHNLAAKNEYNIIGQSSNSSAPSDFIIPAKVNSALIKSSSFRFDQETGNVVIKIETLNSCTLILTIMNEAGQEVRSILKDVTAGSNEAFLKTVSWPSGVYFVQIQKGREIVGNGRFNIIH